MSSDVRPDEKIDILLVDDNRQNIAALNAILDHPSYHLISAFSGQDALKAVLKHDLALILVDVIMEGMDGYELASIIKAREKTRHIPIIFMTATGREDSFVSKAYSLGAADYIEKPLRADVVRAKVAVFAELHRKNRQLLQQARRLRDSEANERENHLLEARAAAEKRFQDMVEGVSHGFVWSADPESLIFTYVSPRAEPLLGFPIDRWRTESGLWLECVHPDDRQAMRELLRGAQTGKDVGIEHRFITAGGETIWLHSGVRLARKGAGAGVEIRGLSVEITYMKQIESALKDALAARDEFLSIASHELRTPLTPMVLQLQLLERALEKGDTTVVSPEKLGKTLDSWRRQVDRLTRLIEELLDVSRISAGRLIIQNEHFDLKHMVEDVIERYRPQLNGAGSEVQVKALAEVSGEWDRSRIEQVFTNLLTNAMKYAPKSALEVTVDQDDQWAILALRDHGPGITEEDQKRIFQRFERAASHDGVSGLGLGLYIAKNIIEAHGGQISVKSERGKGSTFEIRLPRTAAASRSA